MKVTFIFLILYNCYARISLSQKSCGNFETCGQCIGYGEDKCVWCSEPNITGSRCQSDSFNQNNKHWCRPTLIYNPAMESHEVVKNQTFFAGNVTMTAVQFQPQNLTIKLRPGASLDFDMLYKPAIDFPLDVYYLLDYSNTMRRHVAVLQAQAENVYRELTRFTNNVRFGVGTFVEKPDFPFVNNEVQTAYSFRNLLSLTKDIAAFKEVIQGNVDGSNYDDPEAGLDGLMQVMACEKELGWRSDARRIIILCTDDTYHSAGDGKMVGAGMPNDMKCHLNKSNVYDYSLIQDYPSVSQLNKMASDGNFRIIFAAMNTVKNEYEALAMQILDARYAELKVKSNMLDIIKSAYLESTRFLTIKYQWPSNVQLKLKPDCTKKDNCEIRHQEVLSIKATIKVTRCPEKEEEWDQVLEVGPVSGGLADKLEIKLKIDCQCDCEKDESGITNSTLCSNSGTLQCGVCKCDSGRYGVTCQCDGKATSKTDLDKCKQDKNQTAFCNGRGTCVCGICACKRGFSGDFCEFDDNSCKRRDNKLCSGHGRCSHGACNCDTSEWTGDDCSCTVRNTDCFAPYSKKICSGNGKCICGECVCQTPEGDSAKPYGVFCEEEQCKELEDYAYCNYLSNKTFCDMLEQFNQTSSTEVQIMNKTEINNATWPTVKWCHKIVDNGSSVTFGYDYVKSAKKLHIIIQKELEDPVKPNIWMPVVIAIVTVLLIGLLTIIAWKILVDMMDKKEYEKFVRESQEAGFDVSENPIYQPAATNFNNPMFNSRDRLHS